MFGYPGGAVRCRSIDEAAHRAGRHRAHSLVRHESKGAGHMAERATARSTGKPAFVLSLRPRRHQCGGPRCRTRLMNRSRSVCSPAGSPPRDTARTPSGMRTTAGITTRPCTQATTGWSKDVTLSWPASFTKPPQSPPPAVPARLCRRCPQDVSRPPAWYTPTSRVIEAEALSAEAVGRTRQDPRGDHLIATAKRPDDLSVGSRINSGRRG